MTEIIN